MYKLGQYTKRFFLGERLLKLVLGFNYCFSNMATLDCLLRSLMFNNNEFKVLSWYLLCTVFLLYLYINVNKSYLHSFFYSELVILINNRHNLAIYIKYFNADFITHPLKYNFSY